MDTCKFSFWIQHTLRTGWHRHGVVRRLGLGGFPATTEPIFRENAVGSAKGLWHHRAVLGPAPHNQASAAWVGVGNGVTWLRCCLLRGEMRSEEIQEEQWWARFSSQPCFRLTELWHTRFQAAWAITGSGQHMPLASQSCLETWLLWFPEPWNLLFPEKGKDYLRSQALTDGNASRISQFSSKGLPEESELARRIPKPARIPKVCPELSCL